MNTITTPKSRRLNRLEGATLTAIFQSFPTLAGAVLLLKLAGSHAIVADKGGAAIFVVLATLFHAQATTWFGPKYPKLFGNVYQPLFYDATLSFSEKLARWRTQPTASLQLVTTVLMLSLLAVGVVSLG